MNIQKMYLRYYKSLIITLIIAVFVVTLIANIPSWILGNAIEHYSQHSLKLYDQKGTFWHGSGLLVAEDNKNRKSAPLILINWNVSLGFKKFVQVKFTTNNDTVAEVYLNKDGAHLENLNLSLSIIQVSDIMAVLENMRLSGNLILTTKHIMLAKKNSGIFTANFNNISSKMSPVNPLGSYKVIFNIENNNMQVTSNNNSILKLSGDGNINFLQLKAEVDEEHKIQMLPLLTVLGIPNQDGSYNLKIY